MPARQTAQPGGLRLRLVVPGNVRHNSGGNVYNAALARELAALGVEVETCPVDGGWPVGSAADRKRLAALLCDDGGAAGSAVGAARNSDAGHVVTLVDGLLACGAPDELEAAAAAGRPAWILLHMPLDDTGLNEAGLERRALRAAAGVICTSTSAAAGIRARHGLDGIRVALPGTDAAALAAGSEPPHLLAVAALLPNKDQSLLLAALSAAHGPAVDGVPGRLRHRGPGLCRAAPGHGDPAGSAGPHPDPGRAAGRGARGGMGRGRPQPAHLAGRDLRTRGHGIDCAGCPRGGPGRHRRRGSARGRHTRSNLRTDARANARSNRSARPCAGGQCSRPAGHRRRPRRGPGSPRGGAAALAVRSRRSAARWRAAAVAARDRLPGWDATARTVLDAVMPGPPAPVSRQPRRRKIRRRNIPLPQHSWWTMTP